MMQKSAGIICFPEQEERQMDPLNIWKLLKKEKETGLIMQ